jgi:uncharacterized metal-binding protein
MSPPAHKLGIISCSGEEIPEGTISRLATRRVLELLRPDTTVTLCLPLFLAGNEAERDFARTHPTITIDGCEKQCAKWGIEEHSGPVSAALVVSEILDGTCEACRCSSRERGQADKEAVWAVAERLAAEVDTVLAQSAPEGIPADTAEAEACACSSPVPGGKITLNGETVTIAGLPLIFEQCAEDGVPADEPGSAALLETVKIYHPVPPGEESSYREALLKAYQQFRREA